VPIVSHGKAQELNVTRSIPGVGAPFTSALPRSAILPGDGNYRDNVNAGIMAMTVKGIAMGAGPVRAADRRARGNRR
jgi:hypothetical protein